jgi:hypothetical protein
LIISKAVDKNTAKEQAEQRNEKESDRRHLYLAQEGGM